jgi:hypothetical protein
VTEERLRIARDMHDTVAHSLSMITMKASIARHVAAGTSSPAEWTGSSSKGSGAEGSGSTGSSGSAPAGSVQRDGGAAPLIGQRLAALRSEFENGQARLLDLERQEAFLRERLLMLRGAIQALDELQVELADAGSASFT